MDQYFTSETCFTCCEKPIHFHKLSDSDGDSKLNIRHIICQHFWFKEDELRGDIVCETCWKKVDQFHQFYLDVKKLHEHREEAPPEVFIKQEEISIEETQHQEICMDTSAENPQLFDIADYKPEITEDRVEIPREEEPAFFIKQEEISIEETQHQENCMDIAENPQLFDIADYKLEITEKRDELPRKEEPAEVPHLRIKKKFTRRLPNKSVAHRKKHYSRKQLTPEERQAEDYFIKQHTRYICDDCNIEFGSFGEIRNHRIKEHKKFTVMCCGNQHRTRGMLYEHAQSVLNPEAFKCDICGKTFKSTFNCVRHKEMHHAAEEDLVFKCNRCPKSFIKEGLLKSHLAEHEALGNETAKCEFCGKCFRNKSRLNAHVKEVHKKSMDFICEICSKGFYLRAVFLKHQKTHEFTPDQLKEQCPICNKWLKSHSNWLAHVQRHEEKECKCEVCGHVSSNTMSLKRHMKYMHAPDRKRHVCELCGKEYARAVTLKEHVAYVHTREHLYKCEYCEKKFRWSASRNLHRRKNHPQQWQEDHMSNYAGREEMSVDGGSVSCTSLAGLQLREAATVGDGDSVDKTF